MAAMRVAARLQYWIDGWAALARHDRVPGYRELGRCARLRLDLAVIGGAIRVGGFWRAFFISVALALAAQVLVWTHDLRGWRRDALQSLPAVIAAPWVAAGRRRALERLLGERAAATENGVTARPDATLHSAASRTTERGAWRRFFTVRRMRLVPPASGGWMSRWRSRAWDCWRRWRCRARGT